jgi:Ni/Fe-hydrogenase subunit HybB-like protein
LLPLHFYISAIGAGIGMVILESYMSKRAFHRHLEMDLLEPLARGMVVALGIYGLMRMQAIHRSHAFGSILNLSYEGQMFLVEFTLGVILPVALLSFRRLRSDPNWLVAGSFCAVLGFVMNRLNVSITGMEAASGVHYIPSAMEIIVSVGLVATGMAVFAFAVRNFSIFPDGPLSQSQEQKEGA